MDITDIEAYLLITIFSLFFIFLFTRKYNFLLAHRERYDPNVVTLGFTSKPQSLFDAVKMLVHKVPVADVSIFYKDYVYYFDKNGLFTTRRVLPIDITGNVILKKIQFNEKKKDFSKILERSFKVDHSKVSLNLNEQFASNLLIGLGLIENSHSAAKLLDILG